MTSEWSAEDVERLEIVKLAIGGDVEAQQELTRRSFGTRDLDEADRRARVIWEWKDENEAER